MESWWKSAVVYQIYPRSFQDGDGDGMGDIRGIVDRLDHIAWLGADAIWLSPMYPSPGADNGYDVADYCDVDPALGTLADMDLLLERADALGLRVLLDLVASHTSIEHPWFREHPDRYVWADGGPPNNWVATFGGPAWTLDERSGRWYLHSFFPEQPDLDWSNPEVHEEMSEVIRFWLDRGVDGFRVDAADRLAKDPEMRDEPPASEPFPFPLDEEAATLEARHSRGSGDIGHALRTLRSAAGESYLVGEVYLPAPRLGEYLRFFDEVFSFDLLHADCTEPALRGALERDGSIDGMAWVIANHDFSRIATRWGTENVRVAAMLLLTLPGTAFVYQGDEIGMTDGPGTEPPTDRFGRDAFRHPMQWEASPGGGFSNGTPWLPAVDPPVRNVTDQAADADSVLSLYRELIARRRDLSGPLELLEGGGGLLEYRRGEHLVSLNLSDAPARPAALGELVLGTAPGALKDGALAPRAGAIQRP